MQTNVIDFNARKRPFDDTIVYVGDTVEWEDYDGTAFQSVVTQIGFRDVEGVTFNKELKSMPLWEKEEYVLYLSLGASILGSIVIRKVIKRTRVASKTVAKGIN